MVTIRLPREANFKRYTVDTQIHTLSIHYHTLLIIVTYCSVFFFSYEVLQYSFAMPEKGLSPWLRKLWRSRRWRSGNDRRIAMRSGGWTSNWIQLKPTTSYFSRRFVAWNCLKAWELAGYFPAEKLQKHDTIASYCSSYLSIFSGFKLGAPKLPSNFWTRAGFRPRQLSLQRRIIGITVVSGMMAATFFGTLLIPVFYLLLQRMREYFDPAKANCWPPVSLTNQASCSEAFFLLLIHRANSTQWTRLEGISESSVTTYEWLHLQRPYCTSCVSGRSWPRQKRQAPDSWKKSNKHNKPC